MNTKNIRYGLFILFLILLFGLFFYIGLAVLDSQNICYQMNVTGCS